MSLLTNVIHKMREGTRLSDAIRSAIDDAKHEKAVAQVISLKQAWALKDTEEPPLSAEELEAFNKRMSGPPSSFERRMENFNRLSDELQESMRFAACDKIFSGMGGAVNFNNAFRELQGYIAAARTVGETVLEAFDKYMYDVRMAEKSGDMTHMSVQDISRLRNEIESSAVDIAWKNTEENPVMGAPIPIPEPRSGVVVETRNQVKEFMTLENELSGKITEGMQYLYNMRRNYEIFSQMIHEGANFDMIKDKLKNSLCGGNEPADALDTRIRYFVDEYNLHNGSRELSLRFMAERMQEFNNMVETSTVGKVANEMDVNPNRNFISVDRTSNFDAIMAAIGADAFQDMVGQFKKDKELEEALRQIEQHNRVIFADTNLVDSGKALVDSKGNILKDENGNPKPKYYFSTTALYDNGLPSGLELRFDIGADNKVALAEIAFHGQKLDQTTFLQTPEIQQIVAQLPPSMRSQMEKNLVVRFENGAYHTGIVANAASKEAIDLQKSKAIQEQMESGFQVVFGGKATAEPEKKLSDVDVDKDDDIDLM